VDAAGRPRARPGRRRGPRRAASRHGRPGAGAGRSRTRQAEPGTIAGGDAPGTPAVRREPTTGQSLYKWACNAKCLPRVNAIGKARGWHKLVTHWDADQVATAYRELTAEPVVNGRPR
jgi:hypothetical protein